MPQPKSSSSGRSTKGKGKTSSSSGTTSSRSSGGGSSSKGRRSSSSAKGDDPRLAQVRELLGQAVVLPAERLQAVLDDARKRGHIDARGVEDIAQGLLKQAEEVRRDLEELLGRGVANVEDAVARATEGARAARRKATEAGEPLLRAVGRGAKDGTQPSETARTKQAAKASSGGGSKAKASSSGSKAKASSGGSKAKASSGGGKAKASGNGGGTSKASASGGGSRGFPIKGYDDLKAAEVTAKLDGLTAAQLKKVRKHEEEHGARKSVLQAIDRRLS